MTQQERQLLLKDLSARLPYDVRFSYPSFSNVPQLLMSIGNYATIEINEYIEDPPKLEDIKPYLRPMSSMTEDEKELYKGFAVAFGDSRDIMLPNYAAMDWLNKHHFDYRGLIEKGLALEAPEGMYLSKAITD